jgi:anti-sigma regulatory factor (Ser/Thr protein kinase)
MVILLLTDMEYIVYKGNCYKDLRIHFSPKLNGADFFKILELVEFPFKESDNVLLKYALTELVTNSVRALHERHIDKDVLIDFRIAGNFLKIIVTDHAGGFDLSLLPLNINDESRELDLTATEFQEYRERHQFSRFGIGLISAKMALDAFHLVFINEAGKECAWQGEGSVAGTRITAAKRLTGAQKADEANSADTSAFVRRNQRHSIFTKALINNSLNGYLVDISADGIKLLLFNRDGLEQDGIISVRIEAVGDLPKAMVFCAVVRWIAEEKAFWQIGSEFVRDAAFPLETVNRLVRVVEGDPKSLGGLVVIEGT